MLANIVGPICETGDTFASDRECDAVISGRSRRFPYRGSLWRDDGEFPTIRAVFVAEVLVDGDRFAVVADRIGAGEIMDAERVPEWLE